MQATSKQEIGRHGERLAQQHLRDHGYTVEAINWRCPLGEIDVVAQKDDALIVVEVRTRSTNTNFGTPEQSITPRKQQKLRQLAEAYVMHTRFPKNTILVQEEQFPNIRFDCIGIFFDRKKPLFHLQHFANVF